MEISLHDITKENWEYVAFMTTNEDKRPTLVEKRDRRDTIDFIENCNLVDI